MMAQFLNWLTPVRLALLGWALVSAAMLIAHAPGFATLATVDPDDALRLVQVRDLLGRQAWWDVSQHRINPAGGGGLMHWSRIVDSPIALGIAALSPLVGTTLAEQLVLALWPLALLALTFVVLARLSSLLGDRRVALIAPLLLATDYMILYQFAPLRIDHHGWQIMLAAVALTMLLQPASGRSGLFAGLAAAALLAISLEGLPGVALFAGLLAIVWLWSGSKAAGARLLTYLWTLVIAAATLQVLTRGPEALVQRWCDALSLPYLAALGVAATLVTVGHWIIERRHGGRLARALLLGVAGACSAAALVAIEPLCLKGPFGTLDPLVQHYWYNNVREGLPWWNTLDDLSGFALAPSLVGLMGCWLGWRRAGEVELAQRWLTLGGALAGMTLLSLLVFRTASTAHLFALPGCAMVGLVLWDKARAIAATVPRVLASLATAVALPPAAGAVLALLIVGVVGSKPANSTAAVPDKPCVDSVSLAGLAKLPPSVLLTPLDIGPHLLQHSAHSVVATGHHRNNAVMAKVIAVFTGPPERAEALARTTGAQLIVVCPAAQEYRNFRDAPGDGLADRLATGPAPDWLVLLDLGAGASLKAWRIVDPAQARREQSARR